MSDERLGQTEHTTMRVGPRFVAVLGECLALAVAGRFVGDPLNGLSELMVGRALMVGTPLSLPWLVWLFMDRSSPARVLTFVEVLFYGALIAYQVLLLVFLPKVMVSSEGFAGMYLWGVCNAVIIFVPILSWHGRERAQRRSRGGE
jgi:hypothetical protein